MCHQRRWPVLNSSQNAICSILLGQLGKEVHPEYALLVDGSEEKGSVPRMREWFSCLLDVSWWCRKSRSGNDWWSCLLVIEIIHSPDRSACLSRLIADLYAGPRAAHCAKIHWPCRPCVWVTVIAGRLRCRCVWFLARHKRRSPGNSCKFCNEEQFSDWSKHR